MSTIKLSIIIPVYNVELYLAECLDSILQQSFNDFEVICVNDGSTDNSLSILQKYAQKDHRIIIIDKIHSGQANSRNVGLNIARGSYIGFVDSDDYIDCKTYEVALSKFTDEIDLVCYNFKFVFENGVKYFQPNEHGYAEGIYSSSDVIRIGINASTGVKVFKKSIIDKFNIRFPDGLYFEDGFFVNAYVYSSNKIYFLDNCFYNYRQRSCSTTGRANNHEKGMAIDLLKNIDKLISFCIRNNVKSEYYQYLSLYFIRLYIVAVSIESALEEINRINILARELISKYDSVLTNNVVYNKIIGDLSYRECGISYMKGLFKVRKSIDKIRFYFVGFRVLTLKNPIVRKIF